MTVQGRLIIAPSAKEPASIDLGNAIATLAALSFIGMGAPPNTHEWG